MIEYRKGDLMAVSSGIIAHGCNAQGVMGSGVAALVKAKYPGAFEQYVADLEMMDKEVVSPLGYVSFWSPTDLNVGLTPDRLFIANCITQNNVGRDGSKYVSYDAIHACGDMNCQTNGDDFSSTLASSAQEAQLPCVVG